MKKLLLIITCFLLFFSKSQASHVIGGEIGWTCLTNGKYQFNMILYRDCRGTSFYYGNEKIDIEGSVFPKNGNGIPFNIINMKPDSNRWQALKHGEISTICSSQFGSSISCGNRDQGTVQRFFYLSDPIILDGIPPNNGWHFYWEAVCCRPAINVKNVNTPFYIGDMLVRASMFPTIAKDKSFPCMDSAPTFMDAPPSVFCRGKIISYSYAVRDDDLDSLVYSWDRPYNHPINDPIALTYLSGFNYDHPTLDSTTDLVEPGKYLDSNSGLVNMHESFFRGVLKYITVGRVDSYKEGVKVSSVFREIAITVKDCDTMPCGKANKPPILKFNGVETSNYELDVAAGEEVKLTVEVFDEDSSGVGSQKQTLKLIPYGARFSNDRINPNNCYTSFAGPNLGPCAYMQNLAPSYDTTILHPSYSIIDTGYLKSEFVWQTDCYRLGENGDPNSYTFYFNAQDDHCPIPGSVSGAITVTIYGSNKRLKASMDCISESNGNNEITWNLNAISAANLIQWYVYGSSTENGPYQLLDSLPANSPLSYSDVATSNHFYFVRSKGYGCDSVVSISAPSDTINNTYVGLKVDNNIDCVQLSWNEERSSYGVSETRRYFIYRASNSGFELIDTVLNSNQYCDKSDVCGATLRYFVEADLSTAICKFIVDTVSINVPNANLNLAVEELNNTLIAKDAFGNYQWYDCNVKRILYGETAQTFVPKDTGSYALILSRFGCSDTSKCIPFFPVGLPELPFKEQIILYPNPSTGTVQLKLGSVAKQVNLKVRNIQGQLLHEKQLINSQTFQLKLPQESGIYFIQLTNSKGERANLKVVKQ